MFWLERSGWQREKQRQSVEHTGLLPPVRHTKVGTVSLLASSRYFGPDMVVGPFFMTQPNPSRPMKRKRNEEYLSSAILVRTHTLKALRHGSHSFTCKLHHACLSVVSVHQMAPPLAEAADIQLQLTTHLSTQKGWNAEFARLVDL